MSDREGQSNLLQAALMPEAFEKAQRLATGPRMAIEGTKQTLSNRLNTMPASK